MTDYAARYGRDTTRRTRELAKLNKRAKGGKPGKGKPEKGAPKMRR